MDKIQVVYWSQGGNTQAMAEAIGRGITEAGKEAEVVFVSDASLDALKEASAFALAQRQKWRSMEQNRKPRDESTNLWTPYLRQRRQGYTMEKRQSL